MSTNVCGRQEKSQNLKCNILFYLKINIFTIYLLSFTSHFPGFLYFSFFEKLGNNPYDGELLELLELRVILFGGLCGHFLQSGFGFFVYVPLPSLFLLVFTKLYFVFFFIRGIFSPLKCSRPSIRKFFCFSSTCDTSYYLSVFFDLNCFLFWK